MTGADVDSAVAAYRALARGGVSDPVVELLDRKGIDLDALLLAQPGGKKIVRADLTELTAAASMLRYDNCDLDRMHMPNVPKMSLKKSDSGVDVFDVRLDGDDPDDLTDDDHLTIASVKHTVQSSPANLRWALEESITADLTPAYMTRQLVVLNGRLQAEGVSDDDAARVFLFLRGFPDSDYVTVIAVAVGAPSLEEAFKHQMTLLSEVADEGGYIFRIVLFPDLATVHERCA
jgi:hypothetical protein